MKNLEAPTHLVKVEDQTGKKAGYTGVVTQILFGDQVLDLGLETREFVAFPQNKRWAMHREGEAIIGEGAKPTGIIFDAGNQLNIEGMKAVSIHRGHWEHRWHNIGGQKNTWVPDEIVLTQPQEISPISSGSIIEK